MFRNKKKQPEVTREQSLDAVVIPNALVRARENDTGVITLIIPFRSPGWIERLSKRFGGGQGERAVELDEVGSFVWRMCDGKTRVRDMIQRLAERHKLNRKEAEASLTAFLKSLAGRGLVGIVIRRPVA